MSTASSGNGTPAVAGGSSAQTSAALNSLSNININQFLQMMLAELQNQDPLDPTSDTDIMNQISQMAQISTSNQLNTTLSSVLLGQSIQNATSLIGQQISGLDDSGNTAQGVVSQVSIVDGSPKLQVGTQTVSLNNVTGILSNSTSNLLSTLLGGILGGNSGGSGTTGGTTTGTTGGAAPTSGSGSTG